MTQPVTLERQTVGIAGLDCADCAITLERRLSEMPGIASCSVRFNSGTADISYDPGITTAGAVSNRIRQLGYAVAPQPARDQVRGFTITGMDCADCASTLQASIASLPDVEFADVNFGTGQLRVRADAERVTDARIRSTVEHLGYRAGLLGQSGTVPRRTILRERRPIEIAVATILVVAAFLMSLFAEMGAFAPALHVIAAAIAGYPVARAALVSIQVRRADMNLLMTIAAVGAVGLRDWAEASTLMLLFALGIALQTATIDRTRGAIRELMAIAPASARVARNGDIESIPVDEVVTGDTVHVVAGERVPVDGVVVDGASELDQSAITGESMPRPVQVGSDVIAGSVNGNGQLSLRASSPGTDTTMTRIIHLIESAHESKAPVQALVERFAAIYTPAVILGALALASIGLIISGGNTEWLYRALVLLVVACPCALVISTPVAFVSALGRASRLGVLFKGSIALEALAAVKQIAFDKTGTLTHGRPEVVSVDVASGHEPGSIVALAAALEAGTSHPIGRGVAHAAEGLTLPPVRDIEIRQGLGIVGRVGDVTVQVGRPDLFDEVPIDLRNVISRGEGLGQTVVLVGADRVAHGALTLADTVRPVSRNVIAAIRALGIRPFLLSGDSGAVAARIGDEVGISDVRAGLLPADKSRLITESDRESPVAMVGDGINDAPALAAARVGIAMGAGGSAAAIEAADVALMSDDLTQLPRAIVLARSTRSIILQNIAFALFAKLAFLVLTVGGYTSLWLAVLADVGASLLVTLNALRLLRADGQPVRAEIAH